MKKQENTEHPFGLSKEIIEMISGTYIAWERSKEQIWPQLVRKLEASASVPVRVIFSPWMRVAVAAMITVLVGFTVFMQVHTRNIHIPAGQQSNIDLPDHSSVKINAQSHLSYKPLLWKFSHRVRLEGEAYFEVKEGKKFEVLSGKCKTVVLGTKFNIYARNDEYKVTCLSGSVKVVEMTNDKEVILQPGQKAELSRDNVLHVQSAINTDQALSWLNNKLSFTSAPIRKVFEEIGRQYGVTILIDEDIDYIYTGNFNKSTSVENVLKLVCRPFNLEFTRKAKDEYLISRHK